MFFMQRPSAFCILILFCSAVYCCSSCSSCRTQCQNQCGGESINFTCNSVNGIVQSTCSCYQNNGGGGGGSGDYSGQEIALIVGCFAVVIFFCCCICICLAVCLRLAVSAPGLAVIIDCMVLANWLLGLLSISGAFDALWATLTESWGMNASQIIQLLIPIIIAFLSLVDHPVANYISLGLCVIFIIIEIVLFSVLFTQESIVPYIGAASILLGGLIVLTTLGLMLRIILTIQERRKKTNTDIIIYEEDPFNPTTIHTETIQNAPRIPLQYGTVAEAQPYQDI
mmetsp:Transcript_4432/g.5466  ORF Transcript_4432/g.5466 Transcript_4432/m.5466 type:complete len:283 (-) Transcript_4432:33-881(-)